MNTAKKRFPSIAGAFTSEGHWRLTQSPKFASNGVVRTVPPEQTVRRAWPLMARVGVTRVAEVTHLDHLGVPNFMTVRPHDRGPGITYYNGKGTTRATAQAGAMMEAIERYSGERCDLPVVRATWAEISRRGAAVEPGSIVVPRVRDLHPREPLEWVEGFDLLHERPSWVPLNTVVCPYEPEGAAPLWYASTNGLASGNNREEALCHALCEVFERDAMAVALTVLELAPAVAAVLADLGAEASGTASAERHRFPLVDLNTLPRRAARVAHRIRAGGLGIYLRDLSSALDLPTFDCMIVERRLDGRWNVHGGCGTHPDARVAVVRALTEATQSRVACIQGGREDLPEVVHAPADVDPEELYGGGDPRPFPAIPSYQHDTIDEDVRFLLARAAASGFEQVVAIDLTRPEVGIPVVRVVVPGAEAWTVFHLHTGRGVLGPRVARLLRGETASGTVNVGRGRA